MGDELTAVKDKLLTKLSCGPIRKSENGKICNLL